MGIVIRCTECEESGQVDGETCETCGGQGSIEIDECPRKYIGAEITEAVNVASLCGNGILPVAGGLMDQSAWFVNVWNQLQHDQNEIESDLAEKLHSG